LALVKNVSFRFVAPAKIESKGAKKKGERGSRRGGFSFTDTGIFQFMAV